MRFSANGARSFPAWGNAPGMGGIPKITSAESAIQSTESLLNPRHSARRNPCRVCAATPGILPEKYDSDGALVARQHIAAQPQADSGSPKRQHSRAARKSRDIEGQPL